MTDREKSERDIAEYRRKRKREYMREYWSRPGMKEWHNAYMREYRRRPDVKERHNAYMREYIRARRLREKESGQGAAEKA